MKKIFFFLLFPIASIAFSQTMTTPSFPTVKLTKLESGSGTDAILTIGVDSKVKKVPKSSIQTALTNPVTGIGTTNYLPKFTGSSSLGNSQIFDNGTYVGIGTTTPSGKLDLGPYTDQAMYLYSNGSDKYGIDMTRYDGGDYSTNIFAGAGGSIKFRTGAVSPIQSTRMLIDRFGGVTINSLGTGPVYSNSGMLTNNNPSDIRLKENVCDLDYGLSEILRLRPVTYNWINDRTNQGKQFGFIAQEVKEIMPDLVKEFSIEEKDGTIMRFGLDKEGIYVALVNAVKDLKLQIDSLKQEINELKNK